MKCQFYFHLETEDGSSLSLVFNDCLPFFPRNGDEITIAGSDYTVDSASYCVDDSKLHVFLEPRPLLASESWHDALEKYEGWGWEYLDCDGDAQCVCEDKKP